MDALYKEIIIVLISIFIGLSLIGIMATRYFTKHHEDGQEDDNNLSEIGSVLEKPLLSTTSKEPLEWRVVIERIEVIENRLEQLQNQKATRKLWGLLLSILFPVILAGAPLLYITLMISQKLR